MRVIVTVSLDTHRQIRAEIELDRAWAPSATAQELIEKACAEARKLWPYDTYPLSPTVEIET